MRKNKIKYVKCPACQGTGEDPDCPGCPCDVCEGKTIIPELTADDPSNDNTPEDG